MILEIQEDQNLLTEFQTLGAETKKYLCEAYIYLNFKNKEEVKVENTEN